ncbi:MAG: stalk domain-containing protein [Solirubrobacterales bacterium]
MKKSWLSPVTIGVVGALFWLLSGNIPAEAGVPATPSDFVAFPFETQMSLTWTDNSEAGSVNNETCFEIVRNPAFASQCILPSGTTSYIDTAVAPMATYAYKVIAINADGEAASVEWVATIPGPPTPVPAPAAPDSPTALGFRIISPSSVNICWGDNSYNETRFVVERKIGYGDFSVIAETPANVATYTDSGLPRGQIFTYRVRACNGIGYSGYSNDCVVNPSNVPDTPIQLQATNLGSSIMLHWIDTALNESGFKIERKVDNGSYSEIAVLGANIEYYTDSALTQNGTHTYRICSYNGSGNSLYSTEASVTVSISSLPSPPINLKASVSGETVKLEWADTSSSETGYEIERKIEKGDFWGLTTLGSNVTSYTDSAVVRGTAYTYRVRAYNNYGCSNFASEASVIAGLQPPPGKAGQPAATDAAKTAAVKKQIKLTVGMKQCQVNDQTRTLDAAPFIKDERVYLPLRAVSDALGAEVAWDPSEGRATLKNGGNEVIVWVGQNRAVVNGTFQIIDPQTAYIKPLMVPPGRIMLPLRFVAEKLGCLIEWNATTRNITISYL